MCVFIVHSSLSAPDLIMILLKAGMELDVAQLRETGARVLVIGVTGTVGRKRDRRGYL